MDVPGLSGTWRQRVDQLSQRLYGKKWDGQTNTGIDLLNQINKGNYGAAPTPTASQPSTIEQLAAQAIASIKDLPQKSFADQYGTEEAYINAQKPLIEAGVAEQTNKYILPKLDKSIQDIRTEFANRGLFRSGIRGKAEDTTVRNIAEEEATMREQLYGTRESELGQRYAKMQSDYENALKTGSRYTGATPADFTMTPQQVYTPVKTAGEKYSAFSSAENLAPGQSKYAQAYKDWYEKQFKKTRPDVSYNIY